MTCSDTEKKEGRLRAVILAGYDKYDLITKRKYEKELREAYGEAIFLGENKFLYDLAGRPVIQWVMDAVCGAKKDGKPLYEEVVIYNDIETFSKAVDLSAYPQVTVRQMTESVGGHLRDFYGLMAPGDRTDIFFGDTPRITSGDVEYIYGEFSEILGKKTDCRGYTVHNIFSLVESDDMGDNWLPHRIKYVKRGPNKGKLKSYMGFDTFQARVGNAGSIEKYPGNDVLVENRVLNFLYNLRKALSPSVFSKIMYHLWKGKKIGLIKQIKNRCIVQDEFYLTAIDIVEMLYRVKIGPYGGCLYHIKKNAARWENDVDSPEDLVALREKFRETGIC